MQFVNAYFKLSFRKSGICILQLATRYLLTLTESLRVVPKLQNALNAMSRCKEKIISGL
jgi:hypothetical protein